MASRGKLKQEVHYMLNVLAGLCVLDASNANEEKRGSFLELLQQVICLKADILSRISHTEPGNVKAFYKKLYADFNNGVAEVYNKLEELSKNN